MNLTAAQHIKIYDQKVTSRSTLDSYVQEVLYYTLPHKAYITKPHVLGDRLPTDLYDSTAINAAQYFAAGFYSYMTNPQARWVAMAPEDRKDWNKPGVRQYFKDSEDVMYDAFNDSNFYSEIAEVYLNFATVGTDLFYIEEDTEKENARYLSIPYESYQIIEDSNRRVTTVYVVFDYTAQQAYERFGPKALQANQKVKDAYEKFDVETTFRYILVVHPRDYFDSNKADAKNMPFASMWIDKDVKAAVKEGGYREFPFMGTRFIRAGNLVYGFSPAMFVFPDIKMLNNMSMTNLMGGQIAVAPPMQVPDEIFLKPYDFNPWGVNIKTGGDPQEQIRAILTGGQVPIGLEMEDRRRAMIKMAFLNDLFLTLADDKNRTAEEVRQLVGERMLLLGPGLGRVMSELLKPTVERKFAIMARTGKLPPLPDALIGRGYTMTFISPLAKAQRLAELGSVNTFMQFMAQFETVEPGLAHYKINFNEAVNLVADITSVSPKLIRSDDEAEAMRDQDMQARQQAMQLTALQQGTDIAKTASETDANLAAAAQGGPK